MGKLMPLLEHCAVQNLRGAHARTGLGRVDEVREILHNRIENLRVFVEDAGDHAQLSAELMVRPERGQRQLTLSIPSHEPEFRLVATSLVSQVCQLDSNKRV